MELKAVQAMRFPARDRVAVVLKRTATQPFLEYFDPFDCQLNCHVDVLMVRELAKGRLEEG